jgi:hypothetical protein
MGGRKSQTENLPMSKQAVLLIHGIGEQKPMDTLRSFVDAVWVKATDIQNEFAVRNAGTLVWSKPDTVSESFELRRLTTPQNVAGIRTDFYEFYWQHMMRGTTYGHVVAWAKSLLLRKPSTVPVQLRLSYWVLWIVIVIVLIAAIVIAVSGAVSEEAPLPWWMSLVISVVVLPFVGLVMKEIVGDAARYLHVAPANVQCRHEIRQAGIKVLRTLHQRGYDRIMLVGHSLGSVIGYDILTHSWPSFNWIEPTADPPSSEALDAVEALAADRSTDVTQIQDAQRQYFEEFRSNGGEWRVTDFVTMGSPLAHAAILLARNADDLSAKQQQREAPTCLPALEPFIRNHQRGERFAFESQRFPGFRIAHHAAVFALTRWTNLYFPNSRIVVGDLIGGPLSPVFGSGIRDVPVTTTQRAGLLSHTLYWILADGVDDAPHVAAVREALDLTDERRSPAVATT